MCHALGRILRIRVGDVIYTAGQVGIGPLTGQVAGDTFAAQARQALTNLKALLEDAGVTMEGVVKVTCFVSDAAAFGELNELSAEFFPTAPPVRCRRRTKVMRAAAKSLRHGRHTKNLYGPSARG